MKNKTSHAWLNSKEARKKLKVSACDLMHMREAGKLKFQKLGNAYYYNVSNAKLSKQKSSEET